MGKNREIGGSKGVCIWNDPINSRKDFNLYKLFDGSASGTYSSAEEIQNAHLICGGTIA